MDMPLTQLFHIQKCIAHMSKIQEGYSASSVPNSQKPGTNLSAHQWGYVRYMARVEQNTVLQWKRTRWNEMESQENISMLH